MLALPLAPATNILLLTGGLLLLYLELNRPGLVLPGCAGLVLLLTATASLAAGPRPTASLALLALALLLFAAATRLPFLVIVLAGGASFFLSFVLPANPKAPGLLILAAICATILTGLTHSLASIAYRARANKTHGKTHKNALHHLD